MTDARRQLDNACGVMRLCERPTGHDGPHMTSVDRVLGPSSDARRQLPLDEAELVSRFSYHAPHDDQPGHYVRIRAEALMLAQTIVELTPPSREQSLALTNLEQAVMWANAAIARHG